MIEVFLKIVGVVLAGGVSSRMGEDKAQFLFAKQTLLARSVTLLSRQACSAVVVSGHYQDQGFQCIDDINPSLGPMGGLHACIDALYEEYDAMFIIPVDMPLLTDIDCQYLLQQFSDHPQGVFYEHAIFPMILPLTANLKEYVNEALNAKAHKQRSLYRLLNTLKVHAINTPIDTHFRFKNSNTPAEWAECLAIYHALQHAKDIQ